jgi:hypothetical protein
MVQNLPRQALLHRSRMITLFDFIGLLGVLLSLFCYGRVQLQREYAKKISYSLLNFVSALLLSVSLFKNWNLSSFVCNALWGMISAYGVYRCLKYMVLEKCSKTQP